MWGPTNRTNRDFDTQDLCYFALSKLGEIFRAANKQMKTQIRFSKSDVILLTKTRGSIEPYRMRTLTEAEKNKIPPFYHYLIWRKKTDRPPRRRLSPMVARPTPPSMKGVQSEEEQVRYRSNDSMGTTPSKRIKTTDNIESNDVILSSEDEEI